MKKAKIVKILAIFTFGVIVAASIRGIGILLKNSGTRTVAELNSRLVSNTEQNKCDPKTMATCEKAPPSKESWPTDSIIPNARRMVQEFATKGVEVNFSNEKICVNSYGVNAYVTGLYREDGRNSGPSQRYVVNTHSGINKLMTEDDIDCGNRIIVESVENGLRNGRDCAQSYTDGMWEVYKAKSENRNICR